MVTETKVIREKKLDKKCTLRVLKNEAAERIFVEFSSKDGKLTLQRSYQDTYYGREEAKVFEGSIKSIDDLVAYFEEKRNVSKIQKLP